MDPLLKARLVLVLDECYRETLYRQIHSHTTDPDEQVQIAGAVLATMLRRMYRDQGSVWLEQVLRMVLQPPEAVPAGDGQAQV